MNIIVLRGIDTGMIMKMIKENLIPLKLCTEISLYLCYD